MAAIGSNSNKIFLREARRLVFASKYLWPFLRLFFLRHLSKRCKLCVLPASYTALDENQICQACKSTSKTETSSNNPKDQELTQNLDHLVRSYQNKGKEKFDALVLFSGGKDSTYLFHQLKKRYPQLRIATLLVDNGFMSPIALENAVRVRKKLEATHLTHKLPFPFVKRVFTYAFTHFNQQKGYNLVDLLDGTLTFHAARNVAAEMAIPLIFAGLAKAQAENIFDLKGFELTTEKDADVLKNQGGIVLKNVFSKEDMSHFWEPDRHSKETHPRVIVPFMAWNPTETDVLETVKQLGLLDEKNRSPIITNSRLIPLASLVEFRKRGVTSFEIEFSKMIRQGKSCRSEWISIFEITEVSSKTGLFVGKGITQTLHDLGLTREKVGLNAS